jgi:hypothetical protein
MNAKDRASGDKDYDYCHAQMEDATNKITAIYNTVNQIKTKYGQAREQDRVRLNNRVEQNLIECLKLIDVEAGTDSFTDYDGNDVK